MHHLQFRNYCLFPRQFVIALWDAQIYNMSMSQSKAGFCGSQVYNSYDSFQKKNQVRDVIVEPFVASLNR